MNPLLQLAFSLNDPSAIVAEPVKVHGKHHIEARGYRSRPGTGPAGETCGSCDHIIKCRKWAKCALMAHAWTHSRRTDVLVKSTACQHWQAASISKAVPQPQPTKTTQ